MGSGHFLIRACQYLAEEIATNPYTADLEADELTGDESTITFWKRRVAENCLYGVDVNPMAVELAKLAIWLETVAADVPLTFLDHHFRCGDSIIGARVSDLNTLPGEQGLFEGHFTDEIEAALPKLLQPLDDIHNIQSDIAEHVKEKERIFRRRFLPILSRFATVGNLWSAEAMEQRSILPEQYSDVVQLLGTKRRFETIIGKAWARNILERIASNAVYPFHWELAYPEVFMNPADPDRQGFDVIIGNPPYDVLSEKEIGQNIDYLKRFISLDQTLSPSLVGKNNLYKLFICRSSELLRNGGILSFIVPMAILGDEQARDVRRMLLSSGAFREIHAFPQKDNSARRVFRDAKLSTALFVFEKRQADGDEQSNFSSYVHPAQYIEHDSLSVELDTTSIMLYDPNNVTIVSCGQDDWNLVASLAKLPIARLGDFVEFFQGEVNQTVATKRGFLTDEDNGPLVTRGANICLYQLREASQGEDIYLNVAAFLHGKGENTKAFHHRLERVGLQESSPQNNFRRIIPCRISKGQFCNHTINYTTEQHSKIDFELVLFVLNSAFAEWYFRLGSTNAHVSHYQLKNIPCPQFGNDKSKPERGMIQNTKSLIQANDWHNLEIECVTLAESERCSSTVEEVIKMLVRFIEDQEAVRGQIRRAERSRLAEDGQMAQRILDLLYLCLIGIAKEQYEYIDNRLKAML